jgi:D-alanyl-D-alanine carboxypeptidase (penicillin-binding protein 5/6)
MILALASAPVAHAEPGFRPSRFAAISVDAESGDTLFSRSADAKRYPASLTKVMTLYLAFDEIEAGRLSLNERLVVSPHAAAQPPTKLGLRAGERLTVREAIDAIAVKSANDIAVALAEHIAGSEGKFAKRMNSKARALGMTKTHFTNASGLPDARQTTTARDLVRLGRAFLDDHPDGYEVFAKQQVVVRGRRIHGHNRLLARSGIDGIKTGYTRASGFNLMTSGVDDGRRVVAVVLGGDTAKIRDAYMGKLIKKSFATLAQAPRAQDVKLTSAKVAKELKVAKAEEATPAGAGDAGDVSGKPASEMPPPAPAAEEVATGELWWVQVGAFETAESAWSQLEMIAARHPDRFAAAPRGVDQPGSLYQARFNMFSEKAARDSCGVLQAEGQACVWFGADDAG